MSDEQAIRDLTELWANLTAAGDLSGVMALMDEDAVFLTPGHPPMVGKLAFREAFLAATEMMHLNSTADVQEIRVLGEWAYCWSRLTVTVSPKSGGEGRILSGDTLTIFSRESGDWLLVRDANMLAPK